MNVPPATRLTLRDNSGRISTALAREASAAYRLDDDTERDMKIAGLKVAERRFRRRDAGA